jgi:PAS domain S-box-containing protein
LPEAGTRAGAPGAEERLDALPCGVVSYLDDGTIVAVNATLATMLGYERDELVGRHVETLLTVAGRIFFQTHLYPLVRLQGRAEELFVLLRRKDGSDAGALLNAARRERAGGAVTDCAIMEVRERRKFEDALLRAKQAADAALAALEERTRALEAANDVLERQAVELQRQQRQLEEQATELEAQHEELLSMNEELVTRTEELEEARRSAEEANRAKSQFLAVMSHELRTPLNAIGGYVQLIELGIHGPVTEKQREALGRITRGQRHLLRLINEVLNLARIEAGHVDYTMEDVPVAEVVEAVLPLVEPQLAAAELTCATSVAPGLVARADRERFQQVLINLLTNAVKFTPAGGRITVVAERDPAAARVLVSVVDTGVGIAAEKLESVFEPFVRVDGEHTRRAEGTGLGLAISRDLVRGMGGDLWARSEEGRGSTFTLALALSTKEQQVP